MSHTHFALAITALVTLVVGGATAQQNTPPDAGTVKQVMLTMTIPASDAIFSAASEPPKDPQAWLELRKNVLTLAESGDLLMTGGRAKDTTAWMEMARALVTQARATLKAVDARNADALAQAGDDVYTTCETCHAKYMEQ